MSDPTSEKKIDQPNVLRRRLAKGGLAMPVVLATLASRPVLGAAPHNCTISGQVSGNVSTHEQGNCTLLGNNPDYYAALTPTSWPTSVSVNDWLNRRGSPLPFPDAPVSLFYTYHFKDAYEKVSPSNAISTASVRDVLAGYVVVTSPVMPTAPALGWILRARSGYVTDLGLGRETIAACMNAIAFAPNFPLTLSQVAAMFNAVVVVGGTYQVAPGITWNATQVRDYFRGLHS